MRPRNFKVGWFYLPNPYVPIAAEQILALFFRGFVPPPAYPLFSCD